MYTQANRAIAISTPLGTDKLLLESFQASEAISHPFRLELVMLAQVEHSNQGEPGEHQRRPRPGWRPVQPGK